jgi:hypothetical protein
VSRAFVPATAALAALALPGAASAHVGGGAPVATDFEARIVAPVAGLDAKVVDGDRQLWLRVPPTSTVVVPGVQGEPLLRFDARGVWLNLHSLTAQTDRIDRFDLRPSTNPHARPRWHRLTSAHAYEWHEHRLHVLEPLAHGRAGAIGPWSVPLLVDGRLQRLGGVLDHHPAGAVWTRLGLTVALAVAAGAVAFRSSRTAIAFALAATPLVWTVRIARELYGRPDVGVVGYLEAAGTSVVGAALLYGLLHRDREVRLFTAFLVGFGSLYEGLTMLPVLTHAIALTLLPTTAARIAVALILVLGAGTLVGSVRERTS